MSRKKQAITIERTDHADYVYEQFGNLISDFLKVDKDKELRATRSFNIIVTPVHRASKRDKSLPNSSFTKENNT